MEVGRITTSDMRNELSRVCAKVDNRDCGKPCCPLWDLCAALGNPHTTKPEYIRAMWLIYQFRMKEE